MKILFKVIVSAFLAFIVTGCANTQLISDIDPQVKMSEIKSFHVVKFKNDNRGIEKIIAAKLTNMGFEASSGTDSTPAKPVQAIVMYQDKWMWDLTMYMLELNIDFRDPETNYKFATGRSYRTSLARKSPEEMVEEVLNNMFNNSKGMSK